MRWTSMLPAGVAMALVTAVVACGEQRHPGVDSPEPSVAESVTFDPETTMATITGTGTIRIAIEADQPPFRERGLNGELTGFDIEIARIIVDALGIEPGKIEFVVQTSAQHEASLQQEQIDLVMATYPINDRRGQKIGFAGPYYIAGQSLMVRSGNNDITGPESLRSTGTRVCTVPDAASAEAVPTSLAPALVALFDSYSRCIDALRTGQVDAVAADDITLRGFIDRSDGQFTMVDGTFAEVPYGIGIKKGDVAFCEFINDALTRAEESGAYADAWDSTAGVVSAQTPGLPELDPCR